MWRRAFGSFATSSGRAARSIIPGLRHIVVYTGCRCHLRSKWDRERRLPRNPTTYAGRVNDLNRRVLPVAGLPANVASPPCCDLWVGAPQRREWVTERAPATVRPFPLPYDGRTWTTSVSGEP